LLLRLTAALPFRLSATHPRTVAHPRAALMRARAAAGCPALAAFSALMQRILLNLDHLKFYSNLRRILLVFDQYLMRFYLELIVAS
jgi:hypothetical protein